MGQAGSSNPAGPWWDTEAGSGLRALENKAPASDFPISRASGGVSPVGGPGAWLVPLAIPEVMWQERPGRGVLALGPQSW